MSETYEQLMDRLYSGGRWSFWIQCGHRCESSDAIEHYCSKQQGHDGPHACVCDLEVIRAVPEGLRQTCLRAHENHLRAEERRAREDAEFAEWCQHRGIR